jgi:hypothetical protein
MKYLKYYEELNSELSKEVEIIYKDSNLVCLMPKSQKTSKMYGKGAEWCQKSFTGFNFNSGNFNYMTKTSNSEINFIVRFLFKKNKGRKIRFTYKPLENIFFWSNESGNHVMFTTGNEFFNPKPKKVNSTIEQDILKLITEIPQECRDKVNEYINLHKGKHPKDFYIYRNTEYKTNKENKK